MEERRVNWKQIIITAVITGVVTLGAGMLLYHIQMKEPDLTYSVLDALPFQGPSENIAIYYVKIENNGKKIVEDIVCHLSFSPATIKQSGIIAEPSITYNEYILNNSYRVELFNLNPQESVIVSVLASSPDYLPPRPQISLRGKGVIGTEVPETEEENPLRMLGVAAIAAYTGLFTVYLYIRRIGGKEDKGKEDKGKEDKGLESHLDIANQWEVLSYLCGIHNLNSEVELYLKRPSETSYWSEADRFAMLAVEDPTGEDAEKRKQILKALLKYHSSIASVSKGIVHYNIARIAKAQGKEEEADDHLKQAEKIIPELIKKRLEIDPIFRKK